MSLVTEVFGSATVYGKAACQCASGRSSVLAKRIVATETSAISRSNVLQIIKAEFAARKSSSNHVVLCLLLVK